MKLRGQRYKKDGSLSERFFDFSVHTILEKSKSRVKVLGQDGNLYLINIISFKEQVKDYDERRRKKAK